MMNLRRHLHIAAWSGAIVLAAACGQDTESTIDPENLATTMASAEAADEISIHRQGRGFLVELTGESAHSLFDVLDQAGVGPFSQQGVDYRIGRALGCARAGDQAFCQILSNRAERGGDFALTIHGARFSSASSELFGVLAAVNGVSARTVTQVESGRYVCAKDQSTVWCGLSEISAPPPAREAIIAMRMVGLEDLGPDFVYEGWLITPDGPIGSGRFDVSSDDEYFEFTVPDQVARNSSMFVLTIEPAVGDDPAPADTHILAGAFNDGLARVNVNHPAAFGQDFSSAMGGFILATPTSSDPNDDQLGIWFLDPMAGPAPSLDLPQLPAGWVYEGWVAGPNGAVSTGRFTTVEGADSDGAGDAAGPNGAPPFPGQDFIRPPMNLVGLTAVISVEPEPDNSPAPFLLKPLKGSISNATAPTVQRMANDAAASNPVGIVGLFDDRGTLIE